MASNPFQAALNRSNAKFTAPAKTRAGGGTKSLPPSSIGGHSAGQNAPAPPAPPSTPAAPFLTPTQQIALNNWNTKYSGDVANLAQADVNALAKYNQGVSADTQRNAQQVDVTNQSMAARGMFTSSIRDGALNDLASSLQQQLNILQTNYHSIQLADQNARTELSGENAAQQAYYDSVAAANAQALPPVTTPPPAAPAPATTNPVQHPSTTPPPQAPAGGSPNTGLGFQHTGGAAVNGTSQPGGTHSGSVFQAALNRSNAMFAPPKISAPGIKSSAQLRMGGGGTGTLRGGG